MLFRFPMFGGLPGRGVISRMKALLDSHSTVLDNVEGEDGLEVRKNFKGGFTIYLSNSGELSGAIYASYFKLVDSSENGECKIGVVDGGDLENTLCGAGYVNGTYREVLVFKSPAIEEKGAYRVWLLYWVATVADVEHGYVVGENVEIFVGAADDAAPPDNPHGGLACASKLLGRFVVDEPVSGSFIIKTGSIVQDYLQGGEFVALLFGDCLGNSIVEPEA